MSTNEFYPSEVDLPLHITVVEIDPFGFAWHEALRQIADKAVLAGSGRELALKALLAEPGATILAAYHGSILYETLVGVASYRITPEGIKRCNTGTFIPARGFGSALVREMIRRHPGLPMWCKSLPAAWGWCESIGMLATETLPNGWRVYRFTADEAAAFLNPPLPDEAPAP